MPPQIPQNRPITPLLSVVIVNYESWPDVAGLVAGLSGSEGIASGLAEVIVVDNASKSAPPTDLERGPVRVIRRSANDGFAAGVNAGREAARGRWLLLLNPDVVTGPDLIDRVLKRAEVAERDGEDGPGVIGFGLRNRDGTRQGSVGVDPCLLRVAVEPFLPRSRRKYKVESGTEPVPAPWVTGACALVDARLLDELGGMDEDFFLYYEEVALCRSARDRGRAVRYDPGVEVVHLRPLQSRPLSPHMRVVTRHSKLLFFRKHRPRIEFLALSWIVGAEAKVRRAWSQLRRRSLEAAAWGAIRDLAVAMRSGGGPKGRQVLEFAEARLGPVGGTT